MRWKIYHCIHVLRGMARIIYDDKLLNAMESIGKTFVRRDAPSPRSLLVVVHLLLLGVLCQAAVNAAPLDSRQNSQSDVNTAQDTRMQWWREARFGMFIHWGVYSVMAGEFEGRKTDFAGEWIKATLNLTNEQYDPWTKKFHPTQFDAVAWARLAKQAGMKYMIITAKHHDGFCLFDSAKTRFDLPDASPCKRDLLGELAEACRHEGLKFCLYYSIIDWHHPSQIRKPNEGATDLQGNAKEQAKREYIRYMKSQLREIVTRYDPAVLWFDGDWNEWWTAKDGEDLYNYCHGLKPSMLINNRVGKVKKTEQGHHISPVGDFTTPEQEVPSTGLPGVDWEACMTMNDTWGYNRHDVNWKSSQVLVHHLIDIASKGGNLLLNVGPTGTAKIPQASVVRLQQIGRWMALNGQSIYGTQANPFTAGLSWGRCTQKAGVLYLHVFDMPENRILRIPAIENVVHSASLLAIPKVSLPVTKRADSIEIDLSGITEIPMADLASVVVLEIEGPIRVEQPDALGTNNP